ncbi:MAG: hypothetical protein ACRD3W_20885, partial [Terriglobales bacterium]
MAKLVPADFYLIESRSPGKLLEALSVASTWQDYFVQQIQRQSIDMRKAERIKDQLSLEGTHYDLLDKSEVDEIAFCGSDLYVSEGSDLTMLLYANNDSVRQLFDELSNCQKNDVQIRKFQYSGLECIEVSSFDRKISTFAANPLSNLHIRSNSRRALEAVLAVISSKASGSLGDTEEFQYVRTIMPWNRDQEDVFVYLSDAFIRNLIGPKIRIAEHRRRECGANLKMIEAAVLLYCA